MHGLGTDEANLIRVLATKTNDQVIALNKRFSHRFGHKGGLNKWIAGALARLRVGRRPWLTLRAHTLDDTSGDLQRVLQAMAKDEAIADADALKKAMKGLGTDDDQLMDVLADRSLQEIERMKIAFKRRNPENGDLGKWVIDDTSGEFREVLLALRTCTRICGAAHGHHLTDLWSAVGCQWTAAPTLPAAFTTR
jgi:hypothetical protein